MGTQPWKLSGSAIVAADGTAEVRLNNGALPFTIKRLSVLVSTASSPSSVARLYLNGADPAGYVDSTKSGDGNTDTQPELDLSPGETLICQWTGAAVGATAWLHARGEVER